MTQKLIQTQEQKLQQLQRLSAQQMLQVKMLEMPLNELEDNINAELDDNPALETENPDDALMGEGNEDRSALDDSDNSNDDEFGDDAYEAQSEKEERKDELDQALESIGKDDQMPDYNTDRYNTQNADYEEMVYGDTTSFYDKLKEQMDMQILTDKEKQIMEYLIGSLDEDGLLRKDLDSICDELIIYHNIDVSEKEIEHVLHKLQSFDPAGVGGRSLQECLLLQVKRLPKGVLRKTMEEVFEDYFDEFTKKHWDKIKSGLELNETQLETLKDEIRKLNPKPGASLGETDGRNMQQINPDFIVDTADDGTITFTLNRGNMPELTVSPSFTDMIETYKKHKDQMSRKDKEALLYAKEKVDKAQGFIEAIKQRRHTLIITMKAIIDIQRQFFLDGDEADLKPMILKDVAERTKLDISTISRVRIEKYVQTKWGIFPLKFFFTDSYTTEDGEELSTRKIKIALQHLIENEDKKKPLSDDAISKVMKEKGFPIARRTVAKYREQLGIPVARLRK
ncbi:RNA polymerase sigma-54 factor [Prevotella sp. AM42-24]|jgi:RNA polymerase sigma-54 factor|uniref:RNA polymerase factor sigma-54 n=1 Tax=Segatella hominis TaxID=2518605 RepID=A0A4Y8VV08_9BACT|nr:MULTISPECIES: RNA polymerase factor sigma-54 [Prevotellaceae]MBD9272289.1 RNA polymerase sigma-54 factor [Prevotella sp.]RGH35608.1 RNA polymerase sigma-54 factor [Prevotella sp. AM42-24]TFH84350.1 RNA polymerase factor sigma-54 [Segatella hominis]